MKSASRPRRRPIRRRANGEGTIYMRRDGRWRAALTLADGKRRTVYARTNAEVQERLRALAGRDELGLLAGDGGQKLKLYLERWLEETARPSVRSSTYASYQLHVRRLLPFIGHLPLNKLTPAHIQSAYSQLHQGGLSAQTVKHAHSVLHRALSQAVIWGILPRNPCDGAARPRVERREMKALTQEQVRQLFRATCRDRDRALWVLLATTGLRLGEALGLTWADFSGDYEHLYVRRALQRQSGRGLVFVEPKSASSRRLVVLAEGTKAAIVEHRKDQVHHRLSLGEYWHDNDLVFCNDVGQPLDGGGVSWRFHKTSPRPACPRSAFTIFGTPPPAPCSPRAPIPRSSRRCSATARSSSRWTPTVMSRPASRPTRHGACRACSAKPEGPLRAYRRQRTAPDAGGQIAAVSVSAVG